jgi:hypothetical protein
VHYSREATAKKAPGQPLILTALGRLVSTPVLENVEVAAAAGGGGGDNDDDDDDDDDDDEDGDDEGIQKPSGGGIMLVPRAERRSDHRGMASVTKIIGDRKRKATGEPV